MLLDWLPLLLMLLWLWLRVLLSLLKLHCDASPEIIVCIFAVHGAMSHSSRWAPLLHG